MPAHLIVCSCPFHPCCFSIQDGLQGDTQYTLPAADGLYTVVSVETDEIKELEQHVMLTGLSSGKELVSQELCSCLPCVTLTNPVALLA